MNLTKRILATLMAMLLVFGMSAVAASATAPTADDVDAAVDALVTAYNGLSDEAKVTALAALNTAFAAEYADIAAAAAALKTAAATADEAELEEMLTTLGTVSTTISGLATPPAEDDEEDHGILDHLPTFLQKIIGGFSEMFALIGSSFAGLGEKFTGFFGGLGEKIKAAFEKIASLFGTIFPIDINIKVG